MLYPIILFALVWPPACAQENRVETSGWSREATDKWYTYDAKPDYLRYEFSFSQLAIQKYGMASVAQYPCRGFISPGYAAVGKHGNIELRSADPANPNWRYFRDLPCCFLHATQPCPGCYRHAENNPLSGRNAVLTISAVVQGAVVQRLAETLCLYCVQHACATSFCANGEYANSVSVLDPVTDLEMKQLECKSCEPGTWNTCKYKESCKWSVPQHDFVNISQDVHTIGKGPIDACYPCSWASTSFFHYTDSLAKLSIITPDKDWVCPGGESAPVNCKDDRVRNKKYSECVCKGGMYDVEGACQPCPSGFFCQDGIKTKCLDHMYQPSPGASACLPCVDSLDGNGVYSACGPGTQLEWCLQSKPGTQDRVLRNNCRPCHQCSRSFITPVEGEVNCYKAR